MGNFGDWVLKLPKFRHCAEDTVDKLHYHISLYYFITIALVTSSKMHYGHPITCLAPTESPSSWVTYINTYCFINQKLYVEDRLPYHGRNRQTANRSISVSYPRSSSFVSATGGNAAEYYQWVPYIYVLLAISIVLPQAIWIQISHCLGEGLDMESAINIISKNDKFGEGRKKILGAVADLLAGMRNEKRLIGGCTESLLHMLTKWITVVVVVGQLSALTWFVADGDCFWAVKLFQEAFLRGGYFGSSEMTTDRIEGGLFPRVTLCDVSMLQLDNVLHYTIQCVLMFNFINENLFLSVFIWLIFLLCIGTLSAMMCTVAFLVPHIRYVTTLKYMPPPSLLFGPTNHYSASRSRSLLHFFVHSCLGRDGLLMLKAVARQNGRLEAQALAAELFERLVHRSADRSPTVRPWVKPSAPSASDEGKPSIEKEESSILYSPVPAFIQYELTEEPNPPRFHWVMQDEEKEPIGEAVGGDCESAGAAGDSAPGMGVGAPETLSHGVTHHYPHSHPMETEREHHPLFPSNHGTMRPS